MDEKLEQSVHVGVMLDDQVDVTVLKLQGDALPAVERDLVLHLR